MGTPVQSNQSPVALGCARRGFCGRVCGLKCVATGTPCTGIADEEMEMRLLELGFIEGAHISVLHEAPFGGDPIAVRVDGVTIALHRREAMSIEVQPD